MLSRLIAQALRRRQQQPDKFADLRRALARLLGVLPGALAIKSFESATATMDNRLDETGRLGRRVGVAIGVFVLTASPASVDRQVRVAVKKAFGAMGEWPADGFVLIYGRPHGGRRGVLSWTLRAAVEPIPNDTVERLLRLYPQAHRRTGQPVHAGAAAPVAGMVAGTIGPVDAAAEKKPGVDGAGDP